MNLLGFYAGNAKLSPNTFTFSLPAGYACPGAMNCKSQCVKVGDTHKIKDGPLCQFRCYAAIDEVLKPVVRIARWRNFDLLKGKSEAEMAELIQASLPKRRWKFLVRFHVSGDFFSQAYFDAWLKVARQNPKTIFYGYTKSIPFWVARLGVIPKNFRLVASLGGRWDNLAKQYKLRTVQVVHSEAEAKKLGLAIDHDDTHVWRGNKNFALLIHGTQPKGSPAAAAWQRLKEIGKGGYKNQKGGRNWRGRDKHGNFIKKKPVGGTTPIPIGVEVITTKTTDSERVGYSKFEFETA